MNPDKLKALLNLTPLSIEGGHFSETYRSVEVIPQESLLCGIQVRGHSAPHLLLA